MYPPSFSFIHSDNKLFITLIKQGAEYECTISVEDIINLTKNNIRNTQDLERAFKCAVEKSQGWTMVITDCIYKLSYKSIDFCLEFVEKKKDISEDILIILENKKKNKNLKTKWWDDTKIHLTNHTNKYGSLYFSRP
jgi:hypothetical protein